MSKILISINPEYVERIISGEKKFEFRTKIAKRNVSKIIIYCTFPTMKVMAEAEITGTLMMDPKHLWESTKEHSGITKEKFFEYFEGRSTAYAYVLGKVKIYDEAIPLSAFGCKSAPQSFIYVG